MTGDPAGREHAEHVALRPAVTVDLDTGTACLTATCSCGVQLRSTALPLFEFPLPTRIPV